MNDNIATKAIDDSQDNKEYRIYSLNSKYVKALIRSSETTDIEAISERLGITENCLNLKLLSVSNIYIHQAIAIADELRMDICDVFCPTDDQLKTVLYDHAVLGKPIFDGYMKPKRYRPYKISREYIKAHMDINGITHDHLCSLWGVKKPTIFVKLRGHETPNGVKIHIKEGILLAQLLDMDINDLFCPTIDMEIEALVGKSQKSKHNITSDLDINNLYLKNGFIRFLFKRQNKEIKELVGIWGISINSVRSKMRGQYKVPLKDAIKLSDLLGLKMGDIFNDSYLKDEYKALTRSKPKTLNR